MKGKNNTKEKINPEQPIVLGNQVKDIVTGFEGIAVTRVEYLNGCVQYCVKGKMGKDGKVPEGEYIDQQQLIVTGAGISIKQKDTGGVMPDAPKTGMGLSRK